MQKNADGDGPRVVSLTIPADPRWLSLCRLVLSGLCRLGPVDDETLADLKLAVTEACSNSVRHAYGDGSGEVSVRYELGADSLAVEVADAGRGFRFDRPVPELTVVPPEDLREDEMGLAIIHALVDEVDIGQGLDGRGTRISFVKYLAGGPNGSV
jgi:serine/threonine-protein kinase RsbW